MSGCQLQFLNVDGNIVSDSKEYLSDEGASLCKTVSQGTLLVSFKLTLQKVGICWKKTDHQ